MTLQPNSVSNCFPEISGYAIVEQLYEGSRTAVYRATEDTQQRSVAIKVLQNEYPTFNELVQFRNQYAIAVNLNIPDIIRPLSLKPWKNSYALIMEDCGSISLQQYCQDRSLALEEALDIARQLAAILHALHQNRVIHKDIKPANILIHPQTKQVKLIDFSISSLLPKETQEISNPNILEGTLAYISPEQTGRMNRGIDYRSDFYSLGVTLYELLRGELPFQSDDPMELVHCHIAKMPTASANRLEIPQVLSDLVMKLMAKNAEGRYQSALGLKYDLEKCLKQWQETQDIELFELGERDICDRFIIPEKLYGRESEVQTLLDAFERVAHGATEMMLVAGFSGIGKTAVVNEVHKPIVRQRGYFIKGKFDQFNRNIPFSAFVQAFRDLMGQLLSESDIQLQQWKDKILSALGENGQVIIEVIPELEAIVGKQSPVASLSGSAAQNRFNLLFGQFVRVFTTKEHPLVLFLDDLQWADSASLNLLKLLMGDRETGYLLVLGAYRDNEVFPAHPLMLALNEITQNQAIVNTITLEPLTHSGLNHLIADTLSCTLELAFPLTELVYQKTKGNPFFSTQFIKALNEGEWISYNAELGYWQCDMVSVRQLALTEDVVEFMATQLQKLPPQTQEMLKLAACIGNQFNLETLAIVSERSPTETATALWKALQEGLVLPTNEVYKFYQSEENTEDESSVKEQSPKYKFLHDRVQQAAYSLIPEDQKQATHLKIGQFLLNNSQQSERESNLFDIVNQLNIGRQLILGQTERNELARLNLQAGCKAKASTAYSSALEYLRTGIQLLAAESWQSEYELTLALYIEATESSYLNAEFEEADNYSDCVLERGNNILDAVKLYELKIDQKIAEEKAEEALEIGLKILNSLEMSQEQILDYGQREVILPQVEDLANARLMTEPYQLALMQLLVSITSAATVAKPEFMFSIIVTQVHLSLEKGNCSLTAFSYAWYGALLCGYLGEINKGYQAGKLAIELLNRLDKTSLKCKVTSMVYGFIYPWKKHLIQSTNLLLNSFENGLENGDLIYASYSISNYCINLFLIGHNLDDLSRKQKLYIEVFYKRRIEYTIYSMRIWKQLNLNLQGLADDIYQLNGEGINEVVLLSKLPEIGDTWGLFALHVAKQMLLYLLGDCTESAVRSVRAKEYASTVGAWTPIAIHNLYESLALLALYPHADQMTQQEHLKQVAVNQEKMLLWVENAPMNFQHKYDLVDAEQHRVLGNKIEAIKLYDRAIAGAKENEYIQEEALANELAAKFYLDWGFDSAQPNGKEKIAQTYMVEAYYCYARWGAKAKTDHLEQTYPQLLTPILQQPKSPLTLNATTTLNSHQTVRTSTTANTSLLDISAAVKASQALSGEIELEALLAQLMQIVLENAGADKGALVLNNAGTWEVVAQCAKEACELSATPLDNADTLPVSLVRAVQRTQKTIILNQVEKDTRFAADTYLIQQQPKSLFSTPILNQGQLIGILYLENNLSAGAFTTERVDVLNLLCSQAAISIENARLYRQSQDYAKKLEGTVQELQQTQQQLQESFEDLKQAQLQLVQSEKMSALGNLVAGVAHEINNPVGFIGGNLQPAQDYVQDLLGLIDLYQEENPTPSEAIEDEIEAIDLDFLRSDLPQLISSMKLGVDRIAHISTSLRTFSRTDKEHKVSFNLHDGIDSTLLILKHRLKANEQRPEIEIIKEYGNIPEVQCFPGQLNQVFMNLIANAIDALDEGNGDRRFEEIAANPNQITIQTEILEDRVTIRISDNGVGMPQEVKQRIFEQGFTTKGVGKGTGLGMAIARQIIEDKHGGTISCTSQPGQGTEFAIAFSISP